MTPSLLSLVKAAWEGGGEEGEADPLESFATNLNAEAAAGNIDPLIGRT